MSDPTQYYATTPQGGDAALTWPAAPNRYLTMVRATRWYTFVYILVVLALAALVGYSLYYH